MTEPLPWPNSTLLSGNVSTAVAKLKQTPGNDLHIMRSGALIQQLSSTRLIDEYMLSIHPLVLGTGHRLFDDGFARRGSTRRGDSNDHRRHHRHLSIAPLRRSHDQRGQLSE